MVPSSAAYAGAQFDVTVITPTTGRSSLVDLIASIDKQEGGVRIKHLLLWDDKRAPNSPDPLSFSCENRMSFVMPDGFGRFGNAPGSALRSVGLLLATSPWVTFADDDVRWDPIHIGVLLQAAAGLYWASTLRRIWTPSREYIGVDRFESVGDDPSSLAGREMCDNNCMLFRREFGVSAASIYRETTEYDDDRLMYEFMKRYAGRRGRTGIPTIHHLCPPRLVDMFRQHCSPE
jgi:hypothetical protein